MCPLPHRGLAVQIMRPPLPALGPNSRLFVLHDTAPPGSLNPVEKKAKLMESHGASIERASRKIRPTIVEKRELERVITTPLVIQGGALGSAISDEKDRALLWRHVHTLKSNKYALTKFLRSVDWNAPRETREALEHMRAWTPIDTSSALEMLSPFFVHSEVRQHAVDQLERATDDELCSYLLQLVQALRYESVEEKSSKPLAEFLFRRCSRDMTLCNYFFWYLKVETEDEKQGEHFARSLTRFRDVLTLNDAKNGTDFKQMLDDQQALCEDLYLLMEDAKTVKGKEKRQERMRGLLSENGVPGSNQPGPFFQLREFKRPIRVACAPNIRVTGVRGEDCKLFNSAMSPLLCWLKTPEDAHTESAESKRYQVIFKSGDDLRQDQLIMQMFNLMDSLLKKVGLDLKLSPYVILATTQKSGYLEFVQKSTTINACLAEHNHDIGAYLASRNPTPKLLQTAIENFIDSCAGYCVITYLLGIGDRHLDNVMLLPTGQLFHIDFGYIFGQEPPGKANNLLQTLITRITLFR
jgi:phosphatidylinositol 3-kinase